MSNILETICIRVTKHCNLTCSHCRAGSSPFEKEDLCIDNFKDKLNNLKAIGLKHISISGGEPLLIKNIGELIRYFLDSQFEVTLTTNGTIGLYKTDLTQYINPSDHVRIRVSIDGDKKLHESIRGLNTFSKTLDNLVEFKNWNRWTAVNTVIFKDTLQAFPEMIRQVGHIEINEWALISPVIRGNGRNMKVDKWQYPGFLDTAEELLIKNNYTGQIKKWDFINTPNASLLLKSNGDFVLSGVSIDDDVYVTNVNSNFDLTHLARTITEYENKLERAYFKSSRWSKINHT